jgi:predicted SAM-dependent methyltransferase
MKRYVQFGCGLDAPLEWINYDTSPTLRLQKLPLISLLIKTKLNVLFPENVLYGDITKGLPEANNSSDGVYSSHTLEHLALEDLRTALSNTHKILKQGGIFRLVVPDIEFLARNYIKELESGNTEAALHFIGATLLGKEKKSKTLISKVSEIFGNSHHLWMWDYNSLAKELAKAGFNTIRRCEFNDSEDKMFKKVEREGRFICALAIECKK